MCIASAGLGLDCFWFLVGGVLPLGLGGEEIKMTLLWFLGPAWTVFGFWLGAVLLLGLGKEEIKTTLLWFPGPAWTAFGSWLGAVPSTQTQKQSRAHTETIIQLFPTPPHQTPTHPTPSPLLLP